MSDDTFFALVLAFFALVLAFFAYLLVFGQGQHPQGHIQHPQGHRQHPQGHRQHRQGRLQGHIQHPQGHIQQPQGQQPQGQQPHGHRRGPQQPNVEVRMPNIPLVSPIVQTCRTCGIYLNIAVTTLKLNILLSTINRFETEVVRVQRQNIPGRAQTVQFLRDEIDGLIRKRVALSNRFVALEQSLWSL